MPRYSRFFLPSTNSMKTNNHPSLFKINVILFIVPFALGKPPFSLFMCGYTGCKGKCHIFYKIVFFNVPASAILLRIYIFKKQVIKLGVYSSMMHPVQGWSSQICFFNTFLVKIKVYGTEGLPVSDRFNQTAWSVL